MIRSPFVIGLQAYQQHPFPLFDDILVGIMRLSEPEVERDVRPFLTGHNVDNKRIERIDEGKCIFESRRVCSTELMRHYPHHGIIAVSQQIIPAGDYLIIVEQPDIHHRPPVPAARVM
jgi:hypothetical protein